MDERTVHYNVRVCRLSVCHDESKTILYLSHRQLDIERLLVDCLEETGGKRYDGKAPLGGAAWDLQKIMDRW